MKKYLDKISDILKVIGEAFVFVMTNKNDSMVSTIIPQSPIDPDILAPDWNTPQHNWHNVRVLCDLSGLSIAAKNIICACIYQESNFLNYKPDGSPVLRKNFLDDGTLGSSDWGICQINDYWHVRKYPDFPSSTYILGNPQKAVQFMIDAYKNGCLKQWVSYSTGAYKKFLDPVSPMWKLATN